MRHLRLGEQTKDGILNILLIFSLGLAVSGVTWPRAGHKPSTPQNVEYHTWALTPLPQKDLPQYPTLETESDPSSDTSAAPTAVSSTGTATNPASQPTASAVSPSGGSVSTPSLPKKFNLLNPVLNTLQQVTTTLLR